jgi:hypothetical protein
MSQVCNENTWTLELKSRATIQLECESDSRGQLNEADAE